MPLERRDIDSALTRKGFRVDQDSDHDKYWLFYNGTEQAIYTKLSRGTQYRTIGDDLVGKIARQLKLTKPKLEELVDCSMTGPDYRAFLKQRGFSLTSPPPHPPS